MPQYGRIYADDGKGELTGAIIRCCIAIALFFVFKWAGIISGIYAMVYAVQAKSKGHKYGTAAIIMASIVLLIVVVGNFLNFNGS